MSKMELVDTIVRYEWEDFSNVNNEGGAAWCQESPETFKRFRHALLETYSNELLESYLEDVSTARACHRSLMTEKYAWMMEGTDYDRFQEVAACLPLIGYETCERIEHIIKFFLIWQAQAHVLFPNVTRGGRPLVSENDQPGDTSFETYLRGELKSYSARTVAIYDRYVIQCWQSNVNLAIANLDNIARSYGYANATDAERRAG